MRAASARRDALALPQARRPPLRGVEPTFRLDEVFRGEYLNTVEAAML